MSRAAQATKTKSIYGVHPGVAMTQKWIAQLKEKTGRTLEEWMKYIKKEGLPAEPARRDWLKNGLGLGTNTAWWLAERSVGKGEEVGAGKCQVVAQHGKLKDAKAGAKMKKYWSDALERLKEEIE